MAPSALSTNASQGGATSGAQLAPVVAVGRAYAAGRLDEAAGLCEAALADDPRRHGLQNAHAVVRRAAGEFAAAVRAYGRAIALAPGEASYYLNYANALLARGRPGRARRLVLNALRLRRHDLSAHLALAECLSREGRFPEARAVVAPLVARRPSEARIRYAEGNILLHEGANRRAGLAFRRTLALDPGHGTAWMNLGSTARFDGDAALAVRCYERAVARDPNNHAARKMWATTLLVSGRLGEGWDAYEARWRFPEFPSTRRRTDRPVWDGTPRSDRMLLVWPEQGVGDQISYASCVPDLIRSGQPFILECDPRLVPLFRHSFVGAAVRAVTHDASGRETADVPEYDEHIPVASLPRHFRRSLDSFPPRSAYLAAPDDARARWRRSVGALGRGLKVGVAWRSGNMAGERANYYAPLELWRPVLAVPGVIFVNLQYGTRPEERSEFQHRFGITLAEWPGLDLKDDFLDVAALMTSLDLVITGTSAVAEIAGALGAPVWVFDGPPVHFKYLGTGSMPWHPTWRAFTKSVWAEPWDRVFAEMAAALRARVAGRGR